MISSPLDAPQFDANLVVSVFETNIRVLGGLLGAHSMMEYLKENRPNLKDHLVMKVRLLAWAWSPN